MTRRALAAGFLVLLIVLAAVLITLHWDDPEVKMYRAYDIQPIRPVKMLAWPSGSVNVNTANAEEMQQLQGINKAQIQALLDDRDAYGSFDFPEDLMYVKGIGEKTLVKIYNQLDFTWRNQGI